MRGARISGRRSCLQPFAYGHRRSIGLVLAIDLARCLSGIRLYVHDGFPLRIHLIGNDAWIKSMGMEMVSPPLFRSRAAPVNKACAP